MPVAKRWTAEPELKVLKGRLVVSHAPLVKYLAGGVSARMTGPADREDTYSPGDHRSLGAMETYDPRRQTKFES
jgi:RNA polymerase sigma factor for flagellar operon FliA